MPTKTEMVEGIEFHYLKQFVAGTGIIRYGNGRASRDEFVDGLSSTLTKGECEFLYASYRNDDSAQEVAADFNNLYRPNEDLVREEFLEYLSSYLDDDEALFYEHPIGPNRSDVNRFNGQSYTYELKSPRDTSKRIGSQLSAYKRVFEFIYLVLPDEFQTSSNVDETIGIIRYDHGPFRFWVEREPEKQACLDPEFQLHQLRVAELRELAGVKESENYRRNEKAELVNMILSECGPAEVNQRFKETLKDRHLG